MPSPVAGEGKGGGIYPWGNDFNPAFVNSAESGLRATTAVCTYPQGVSPFGVWDLSGNVLEWTLDGETLRGGSWYADRGSARAAVRNWFVPDLFDSDIGFRVVFSPAERTK